MRTNLKTFMIAIVYCFILTILTLVFGACQSEVMYPELNEDQGVYIQLQFINEDSTIEISHIEYK